MTFSFCDRILRTSETSRPLPLMFLEVIICLTLSFIREIKYGKPCLVTRNTLAFWNCSRMDQNPGVALNVHVRFAEGF